jgi:hypothetical protein
MLLTVPYISNQFGAFSPRDLPGILAWYDATQGVYSDLGTTPTVNGGNVLQWNDLSGNNYHLTQPTLPTSQINPPVYNTTGFNSLPTLEFVVANTTGLMHRAIPTGASSTASISAVVLLIDETNSNGTICTLHRTLSQFSENANSMCLKVLAVAGNNSLRLYSGASDRCDSAPGNTPPSNSRSIATLNGTAASLYLNGALADSDTFTDALDLGGPTLDTIDIILGVDLGDVDVTKSRKLSGSISEVVCTLSALNTDQVALLDAYFVAKWGF